MPLSDCARVVDTAELLDAADSAEAAFARVDAPGFAGGRAEVEARLACVGEVLSPAALARVHRVEALGAFLGREDAKVPAALAGMCAAEPGHQVPVALLPEGHPVRGKIGGAMSLLREAGSVALPALHHGWLEVDGQHATVAPAGRAAILQQLGGAGEVLATHYRWPGDDDFGWMEEEKPEVSLQATAPRMVARPLPWLVGAAVAAVGSGVMLGLAAEGAAEFAGDPVLGPEASDTERAEYRTELEGLQARTNALSVGGYAALGAGLALGVVTVIQW